MKLRVASIKGDEAEILVDENDDISTVKKKIFDCVPFFSKAEELKVIHSGKILADALKVKDYEKIKDNDRIVVIAIKKGLTARNNNNTDRCNESDKNPNLSSSKSEGSITTSYSKDSESSGNSVSQSTHSSNDTLTKESNTHQNLENSYPTTYSYQSAASVLITGSEQEKIIDMIVTMGFDRNDAAIALRAAFNNPDRAIEYLTNGFPNELINNTNVGRMNNLSESNNPQCESLNITPNEDTLNSAIDSVLNPSVETPSTAVSNDVLNTLRSNPLFEQLRIVLQTNPQLLPQLISVIGQQNPQLAQAITENQDSFVQMMQEPVSDNTAGNLFTSISHSNQCDERIDSSNTRDTSSLPNEENVINLTSDEMEAISGLESLGFPRDVVVEAYLSCEKNTEMAANYLLENMNDFSGVDEHNSDR